MKNGSFSSFVAKEWRHILRERRTLVMLFAIPLALVLLFGYVISTDIDRTPIAVLDSSHGDPLTRRLLRKLTAADQFRIVDEVRRETDIDAAFKKGTVKMVVVIPSGFGSDARRYGGAQVQLVTDASDLNVATTIIGYASGIVADLNAELNAAQGLSPAADAPLRINVRMMYNPELKSAYMFVPGVIAMIVMIVAAMMTSVTLAREKETGTLRLLTVSPLKARTIVLGKVVPYFALTAVNTALIMLLGTLVFGMPCYGSVWGVALLCSLFILSAIGLGILISSLVKTQQSALTSSLLGLLLPTMLLSGFIFPPANMPVVLQWICQAVPATWFIEGVKGLMLKGQPVTDVWLPLTVLGGMTVLLIGLALWMFSRRERPQP
ncbi:ABC transporter permease [Rikenella microfusus]|uniref:Inner membrane transport permease ybhS n=1 Tax=Rikenella microfusus TaxID=28139 RepID=A0A379MRJ0_9BACT|nr:ABC transporter permease [Rikenella microfusus]SUE33242.1 Inner membrane transport permease ybhS [Rikenella microfusus]